MIILGLGNPGEKYASNRHNAGFLALDAFADAQQASFEEKKIFHAAVLQCGKLILAKPTTFMNASGSAAAALVKQYGEALVLVHDDIDISIGEVKCSFSRGSGDHNGVQSVIDHLGHKDFFRIRIGVRPVHEALLPRIAPPDGFEKFLLSDFTALETEALQRGIEKAAAIIGELQHKSFQEIMNRYN